VRVSKDVAATFAVAGLLAVGAAVACSATAAADAAPPGPGDPAGADPPPPPPSILGETLGQLQNGRPDWLPQPGAPAPGTAPDFMLSQNPVPAVPGGQPSSLPNFGQLNPSQYLFGPNYKLDQQGQQSMYSAGPTDPNAPPPSGRIDAFQRAHGLWHMGLGKLPEDQLGQPLPGTAPPPGMNLPPGLVDDLPAPPEPVPPPASPPPAG